MTSPALKNLSDRPISVPQPAISQAVEADSADPIMAALASVIHAARIQGQSLEELTAEVMADDALLEPDVRRLLSDVVAKAWYMLP